MRVCHCSLAGTEACNHCPSGTMVEPCYPPFDWRDEIIAALRAERDEYRAALEKIYNMEQAIYSYPQELELADMICEDEEQSEVYNIAKQALAGKE